MFRNMRLLGDIFNLFPLLGSRHLLCDFQNGKIQLDCRLGRFCREVVADERGQLMSRLRQLGRLVQGSRPSAIAGPPYPAPSPEPGRKFR